MRYPPPEEYLSWPPPNYTDPETRGSMLIVVPVVLIIIEFLIVVLRLYTRLVHIGRVGADDWLIGVSTCTSITLGALTVNATAYGWGLHIWDNRPEWYVDSRLFSWLCQIMFTTNSGLIKSSILLSPVHGYWDHSVKSKCLNDSVLLVSASVINTCADFWVAFLPAPMLMKVSLPFRQKIILVFLFGFAGLVCIAGVCRTIFLHKTVFATYDVTWYGALSFFWGAIETDIGIATASVPALRPLFHYYFPQMIGSNKSENYSSHVETPDHARPDKNPHNFSLYPLSTYDRTIPRSQSQDPIAGVEEGQGKLDHRGSVESNNAAISGGRDSRGCGDSVGDDPAKATSGV
ncbi:hypothetical protein HOY80DRAFT_1105061 [Tuber brumale]|nr:hypothetical protein HOY80DRAFT_1105061 [Tuber brumale]